MPLKRVDKRRGGDLHEDIDVVLVLEDIVELHDVAVRDRPVDLDFCLELLAAQQCRAFSYRSFDQSDTEQFVPGQTCAFIMGRTHLGHRQDGRWPRCFPFWQVLVRLTAKCQNTD